MNQDQPCGPTLALEGKPGKKTKNWKAATRKGKRLWEPPCTRDDSHLMNAKPRSQEEEMNSRDPKGCGTHTKQRFLGLPVCILAAFSWKVHSHIPLKEMPSSTGPDSGLWKMGKDRKQGGSYVAVAKDLKMGTPCLSQLKVPILLPRCLTSPGAGIRPDHFC